MIGVIKYSVAVFKGRVNNVFQTEVERQLDGKWQKNDNKIRALSYVILISA